MSTIHAYAAINESSPLAPFDISRRAAGDNDVQIEIMYCGVCHSDIHQARNEWGGSIYPMVPGHEIIGTVSKIRNGSIRTLRLATWWALAVLLTPAVPARRVLRTRSNIVISA